MKKIKISQLPLYNSLEGLSTIGTDADNRSVRVELSFIVQAFKEVVAEAKAAAEAAQSVADDTSAAISGKVDKVVGKGLSANDFTDALKAKLEGLSNYDDTEVRSLITAVSGRLDTILGDGASTAIDTFNEIEAFLAGITDTQTLTGLLQEQKQTITNETDDKLAGKVDKVSGKGLSANDYTDEDKAKLTRLLPNGQFGYTGHYGMDGKFYTAPNYANSGLIPVNRNFDIEFAANVGGSVASVVFYDGAKRFISAIQIPQTLAAQVLPAADIPEDATFFIISTASPAQSYYRNGLTIESREGAMAEALASFGRGLVDQFIIKGYFLGKRGNVNVASTKNTGITPLLPLSKTYPIVLKNVRAYNDAVAVCFYDAAGLFISYPEAIQNLDGDYAIQPSDFPENAVFFRGCTERTGSSYSNGPSIESREGAVSEAIQSAKLALFIDEFNAAAGANGKYDPVNAPDPLHPFYLNKLWLTYNEAVASMAHINEIYLRGAVSMSGLNIRTNMLSAKTTPSGWGTGFVILNSVCSLNGTIEVLNVGNIALDKVDNMSMFAYGCANLHTIIGKISMYQTSSVDTSAFAASPKLQEVRLYSLKTSISFKDCPLLSLASLQCIVDNAINTAEITVTVHPVTYGKLTDEQADIMALLPENLAKDAEDDGWKTVNVSKWGAFFTEQNIANIRLRPGDNITVAADVKSLSGRSLKLHVSFRTVAGNAIDFNSDPIEGDEGRPVLNVTIPPQTKRLSVYVLAPDSTVDSIPQQEEYKGLKISIGEHSELPYTEPLSRIEDATLREKAEWASLMQFAEARQINFATTE